MFLSVVERSEVWGRRPGRIVLLHEVKGCPWTSPYASPSMCATSGRSPSKGPVAVTQTWWLSGHVVRVLIVEFDLYAVCFGTGAVLTKSQIRV